jgi:hypothetical protein
MAVIVRAVDGPIPAVGSPSLGVMSSCHPKLPGIKSINRDSIPSLMRRIERGTCSIPLMIITEVGFVETSVATPSYSGNHGTLTRRSPQTTGRSPHHTEKTLSIWSNYGNGYSARRPRAVINQSRPSHTLDMKELSKDKGQISRGECESDARAPQGRSVQVVMGP